MAEQSLKSCFNQKQTASNPETRFSALIAQWQKPLIAQKRPYQKPKPLRQTLKKLSDKKLKPNTQPPNSYPEKYPISEFLEKL